MAAFNIKRAITLGILSLTLVALLACGASESPTTAPAAEPSSSAAPASAPVAAPAPAATAAPGARSTLVPTPTPAPIVEPVMAQEAVGTLNVAYSQLGPPKFIPKVSGAPQSAINTSALWESLWHSDPQGNVIPRLVKEWTVSPDGNVWTLYLEEGVPFHKGKGQMTAEDMIWSMDNVVSKGTVSGRLAQRQTIFYAEGGGMTAIDEHTLVLQRRV